MAKKQIFFRADASATIGYGHFIRTLALADMLKNDFDCTFFTQSPSAYQQREAEKVCPLIALPSDDSKFNRFLEYLTGDEIVVLDNYFYTPEYQNQIKDKGCKLVCIDDMHDKHYIADVVINHGLLDTSLFDVEPYTKLCLGLSYALLRKPFIIPNETQKESGSWFICFGGSDYLNLTEQFLKHIHDDERVKSITVVIGDAYIYKDNLVNYPKAVIKKNLTAEQMAFEMQKSEYAILPTSSVCIEALACNCKVAAGYFIDNQKEFANAIGLERKVLPLCDLTQGFPTNIVDNMIRFNNTIDIPFANIPERYVELFSSLII